ncbi:MAG TPA: helix-turn-helix transcriptional regulator [Roseomonas sp.]|nr:helix-turn-helix transcriptional regulator [Roseomonas sp.]
MLDPRDVALELYGAVLEGGSLEPQLAAVAQALKAETGFISRIALAGEAPTGARAAALHAIEPEILADYETNWLPHDPRVAAALRQPRGVLSFNRLCPPRDFARSMFWNEFGRKKISGSGFHTLSASVAEPEDAIGVLSVHRPQRAEPFGAEEEAFMAALYPHLRRALQAEARLRLSQARAAALDAGLDALPEGVAVIGPRGRLLHANGALREMAALRDGLALSPVGLDLADGAARTALRHALDLVLAVQSGRIRLLPDGTGLSIPRPSGAPPWAAQVLPLRAGIAGPFGDFAGAVVLVVDRARRRAPSAALLQRLLGLSPAEAALAAGLAMGQDLKRQARRRGVSLETLRSHLASIRRKTGCRRQAELVALVLQLSA